MSEKAIQAPDVPMQGVSPEEAIKYLADVAATYSQTLDPVARVPFVGYVNACFSSLVYERSQLSKLVGDLNAQVGSDGE